MTDDHFENNLRCRFAGAGVLRVRGAERFPALPFETLLFAPSGGSEADGYRVTCNKRTGFLPCCSPGDKNADGADKFAIVPADSPFTLEAVGEPGGEILTCACSLVLYGGLRVFSLYDIPAVISVPGAGELLGRLHGIWQENLLTNRRLENALEGNSLAARLAFAVVGSCNQNLESSETIERFLRLAPALEYMEQLCASGSARAPQREFSDYCELTPDMFYQLFKQTVGTPPQEHLIRCRLRAAADAIIREPTGIGNIGAMTGYATAAGFTAMFRKKYGVSPTEYREIFEGTV